MPDVEVLELERACLQLTQVLDLIARQLISCPQCSGLSNLVEPLEVINPSHYFVVIASQDVRAMRSRPLDHVCWPRIVSDDVAATNDLLIFAFCVGENRFKGIPIRVNIAENQELHTRINVIPETQSPFVKRSQPIVSANFALTSDCSSTMQGNVIGCRWFCGI